VAAVPPEVSVVVATHNRREQLAELLASLRAQTLDGARFEVIVVDDASSDGTPEFLAEQRDVRVIRRETGGGPAVARNAGWREARAPLVAFTDDDCTVVPGWLEAGLRAHAESPGSLLQGPVAPDPTVAPPDGPFTRTIRIESLGPYYQTANVFYPRDLLERLDGFDETFPHPGGEDTDLAWRAIEAGSEPKWVPDAQAYHAVNRLDFAALMRLALRWAPSMEVYVRHPGLRDEVFTRGVFWKPNHYMLFRALIALFLPRRLRSFSLMLAWPYLMFLVKPGRLDGGGILTAPIVALYDLVEMAAVAWWSAKRRKLIL
jgi:glycosyltransferase involved in cell wall biosynthesis